MKRILRIVFYILLCALLLAGALFGFIQTSSGKDWLARQVNSRVPNLTLTGLEGSLPWDIRLSSLSLSDAQGVWLEAHDLHLTWQPLMLLSGAWRVEALEAASIHLLRLPAEEEQTQETAFTFPQIPDITLEKLHIETLIVEPAVTGQTHRLTLSGGGNPSQGYRFSVRTLEGPQTTLELFTQTQPELTVNLQFDEAPGGVVAGMLRLPSDIPLKAALEISQPDGVIRLSESSVKLGSAELSGAGSFDAPDSAVSAHFSLSVPDISLFAKATETPLSGALSGELTLGGTLADLQGDAALRSQEVTLGETRPSSAQMQARLAMKEDVTEGNITAGAEVNGEHVQIEASGKQEAQTITLSSLTAAYGPYHTSGNAVIDIAARRFESALTLAPLALSALMNDETRKGSIQASAEAKGGFDRFDLTFTTQAAMPDMTAELKGKGEVEVDQSRFTGALSGHAQGKDARFTLQSDIKATPDRIALTGLSVKGDGLSISGDSTLLLELSQAEGALRLQADKLAPLGAMLGITLAGSAEGSITLTPGRAQQAAIALEGQHVSLESIYLDTLSLRAEGQENTLSGHVQTQGVAGDMPFLLSLDAQGTRSEKQTALTFTRLEGALHGEALTLQKPATFTVQGNDYRLSPLTLSFAGGTLSLQGAMTPGKVDAALTAQNILLASLPAALPPGTLAGKLSVSGKPAAPHAVLEANGELRSSDPPLAYHISGNWQKNTLTLKADGTAQDAVLAAHLALSAPFSLAPVTVGLTEETPLKGSATLEAPLATLGELAGARGLKLSGKTQGSAALSGSLGAPQAKGRLTLANADIEHEDSGACLRGADAVIEASQDRLTLTRLTARNKGALIGHASLELTREMPLKGDIALDHVRLFCGGLASGEVDGRLALSGTISAAMLAGKLTLGPLNIQLPGHTPGQEIIPEIKTVRAEEYANGPSSPTPLTLDITLRAPGRVFMRGRGLDAEFAGHVNISGPADNADFQGILKAERGRFNLLDRDLKLSTAVLRFAGPVPPSPYLEIIGETVAQDTTIRAHLTGLAKTPEFSFTSTPALPRDEILSLLLFGREMASLTPFQAIQLAQSAAELSGISSGPGLLGRLRGALGVDRLDVGTGTDNSVTVGAGKYITDKVYVGIQQGAAPEDREVVTEIELTPKISATSSVDGQGHQGVGLQWKYDY